MHSATSWVKPEYAPLTQEMEKSFSLRAASDGKRDLNCGGLLMKQL